MPKKEPEKEKEAPDELVLPADCGWREALEALAKKLGIKIIQKKG